MAFKNFLLKNITLLCCLLVWEHACGQTAFRLELYHLPTVEKPASVVKLKDSMQADAFLRSLYQSKIKAGYWAFSIDTIIKSESIWKVMLFEGKKYKTIVYENTNLPGPIFETLKDRYGRLQPDAFAKSGSRYFADIGYPFVQIYLDSFFQGNDQLSIKVRTGPLQPIYFSKIVTTTDEVKIAPAFLYDIIGIKPYEIFSYGKINAIKDRLKNVGYFELTADPEINVQDSFCALKIPLKEVRKNRFNGIIGFLPNSETSGDLQLTGDVQVSLQNLFVRGIGLNINWQKLQPYSQSLLMQFEYPYLFNKPIHLNTEFKLLKQDTSFLTLDLRLGFVFVQTRRSSFEVSVQNVSSNLIRIDTAFVFTKVLPEKLDYQILLGGLKYMYRHLDQPLVPRKGFKLDLSILAGYKKINMNEEVVSRVDAEGKSFSYLYDGKTSPSFNSQVGLLVDFYSFISRYFTLKSTIQSKILFSQQILKNENFRIGGNKILRGFDEENIYTPYYIFGGEELRWFLTDKSYLYSFVDVAMVQDNRVKKIKPDFPIGMGIGIALNTKGGIFGVSYAIGKQLDNSFDFRTSKIHFGYINEF